MKNFLSVTDVPHIKSLVQKALDFKTDPRSSRVGEGKRIGLLFLNPSMRTRLSTQLAAANLGMEVIEFNVGQDGWSLEFDDDAIMNGTTVEHVKEAAPILGKYFDVLAIRTFPGLKDKAEDYSEFVIQQFVKYAGISVVSLESATLHPLQSLTDIITITETFHEKRRPKVVLTWAPHVKALPQCVANSFAQWTDAWGEADFVIAHPEGYELDKKFTGNAAITFDQEYALRDADYVYVKNWSSYTRYGEVLTNNPEWMLTNQKIALTNHAKVMHCLPVRRNVELSAEVLDGANSLVTQQAANRVWAAQAVLSEILNG